VQAHVGYTPFTLMMFKPAGNRIYTAAKTAKEPHWLQ